jgi:hypothetical protein
MTYSSGGLIQATDYNGFVSTTSGGNINAVWNSTYGQTALTTVSAAGTVTATQWASLNNTLTSIGNHQGTSLTSRTSPTAGNTIAVLSNLGTDLTTVNTNMFNAYASGSQVINWTGTASQTGVTGNLQSSWTITFTDTLTFANATAATNFFGSGGLVKIQFSKTSTGYSADPEWNNFVNNICGTVYFTSDAASKTIASTTYLGTKVVGGSGTPTVATGTGYNQLTGTPVTIYQQNDTTYNYTGDYVRVQASVSGAVVTFTTTWFSAARVSSTPNRNISGGTATSPGTVTFGTAPTTVVTYLPPETTYLTNTWGTPTVASSVSSTPYA